MKNVLTIVMLAGAIFLLGGTAPSTSSVADAAAVYAYSGMGTDLFIRLCLRKQCLTSVKTICRDNTLFIREGKR